MKQKNRKSQAPNWQEQFNKKEAARRAAIVQPAIKESISSVAPVAEQNNNKASQLREAAMMCRSEARSLSGAKNSMDKRNKAALNARARRFETQARKLTK